MGLHPHRMFGEDYRPLVLTHTADRVPEMHLDRTGGFGYTIAEAPLPSPDPGSFEAGVLGAGRSSELLAVDLRRARQQLPAAELPARIRSQGEIIAAPAAAVFDGVLSVPTATAGDTVGFWSSPSLDVEPAGEMPHGGVDGTAQLDVRVAEPVLVRGQCSAEAGVGDGLRYQRVRGDAEPARDELGDDGAPLGVAQGRVRLQCRYLQDQLQATSMPGRLGGVDPVELDDDRAQCLHQRLVVRAGEELRPHPVELFAEVPPDDVVLGVEVPEERASPDPCRACDRVHGGGVEAVVFEEVERDPLEFMAVRRWPPARPVRHPEGAFRSSFRHNPSILTRDAINLVFAVTRRRGVDRP